MANSNFAKERFRTLNQATLYHDQIIVRPYVRRRNEWKQAADLRIQEYRTSPVNFKIGDCPRCHKAVVKMTKNAFPFGATYNKYMFDDENLRNQWPELFNYAVVENKMKWKSNEWTEDKLNFEYADAMVDLFAQWEVPFRGHTLFWGVKEGGNCPTWFQENPTIAAMYERLQDARENILETILVTVI